MLIIKPARSLLTLRLVTEQSALRAMRVLQESSRIRMYDPKKEMTIEFTTENGGRKELEKLQNELKEKKKLTDLKSIKCEVGIFSFETLIHRTKRGSRNWRSMRR